MPNLSIDGRPVNVPEGTTVIQSAEKLGIFIPRYCYHPGLSIAGNCRICLVEVEKIPKLQIACNTYASEGMVVHTKSKKAEDGRRAVLEFLLANHPLDCPVCDQSGECDLQNFYLNFGLYDPRFREHKVKKRKAVQLGPHVMLDQERCILCSRCVRFTDEITKTGEFGIFNRGDRAELALYPGEVLNNPYSANVVDICPVGALTEKDFRFKVRVWYLSSAPTVCNGCSRGCNVDMHYVLDRPHLNDGARVVRIKPRYNAEVNQWWLCDEGRYGFGWIDRGRLMRISHQPGIDMSVDAANKSVHATSGPSSPSVEHRGARSPACRVGTPADTEKPRADEKSGMTTVPAPSTDGADAGWEEALDEISTALVRARGRDGDAGGTRASIGVIASVQLTNEELFLIREIFHAGLGAEVTASVPEEPGYSDEILIQADKNPNTMGARLLGLAGARARDACEIVDDALEGNLDILWVFGHDLVQLIGEEKVRELRNRLALLVFSGTNENSTAPLAHWVLPTAAYVEKDGTFVNCDGRVQRIGRAFPPPGNAREDWRILLELGAKLGRTIDCHGPEEIFHRLAAAEAAFEGLSYEAIGRQGAPVRHAGETVT